MRVARIEIFGFKSFMDRLILPLEGGITGIVGPNGCGKSNIVDALRWVLGETRASNLRGGVLEDIIFNGTNKLRPLGLAEVTITLRAAEDNFFADLVSPALEAEMLADSVRAEADTIEEDASEVNTDAEEELGELDEDDTRPHLTVIPGKLNDTEQEPTEFDTAALEGANEDEQDQTERSAETEASGAEISAISPTLLAQFSWLKSVSEVQVTRRLYRSGESEFFLNRVPCRLKDLKDFFRAVGLSTRAYTLVAQGEVSRIVTSKAVDRRLILEEAAGVLGFRDKIAAANRRLKDTEVNISRIEDIVKEVDRQVTNLRRQANRARNREDLRLEIATCERALYRDKFLSLSARHVRLDEKYSGERHEEDSAEAELRRVQEEEESARTDLLQVDLEGDDVRSRIDTIREELNNRTRRRTERKSRQSELKAFVMAKETEIRKIEERRTTLEQRIADIKQSVEALAEKEQTLSARMSQIDTGGEERLKEVSSALDSLRRELAEHESQMRDQRDTLVSKQSALSAIQEQIVAASPVEQLKKTLGEENSSALAELSRGAVVFADSLTVPERYARAVQAMLVERSQFLVSENARGIASHFVNETLAGAKDTMGLGLGVFQAGQPENPALPREVSLPRLIDQIQVDRPCQLAASRIFANVYIVSTLEEAQKFFDGCQDTDGITLVTESGEILTNYSFYSMRHESGILQLKNRAEKLEEACEQLTREQDQLAATKAQLVERINQKEAEHRTVLNDLRERQKELRELGNDRGTVLGRLQSERRVLQQIESDLEAAGRQIAESQLRIQEFTAEQHSIQQQIEADTGDDDEALENELRALNEKYRAIDEQRKKGRERLSEFSQRVQGARDRLDQVRSQLSTMMLERQKVDLEEEHLREKVAEEYGPLIAEEVFNALSQEGALEDEVRAEYQETVQRLKKRISREGDVDPTSIQRFEEESTRLEDLRAQHKDLSEAARTLQKTIEKLTETSKTRFVETFEAVRNNFSDLVPRLFGGGKGDLRLSDPENPLESGVDILVRPPGKRPKSIDILSGGEKALCATALIFAMFLVRPSPLCVLDEVDAPLDDANLIRFLSMIKEMSDRTQFILVTHNKQSMALCDQLIGVTMQQPGASNVLTVSLQEAYEQVA